jgi:hypothetical protein
MKLTMRLGFGEAADEQGPIRRGSPDAIGLHFVSGKEPYGSTWHLMGAYRPIVTRSERFVPYLKDQDP